MNKTFFDKHGQMIQVETIDKSLWPKTSKEWGIILLLPFFVGLLATMTIFLWDSIQRTHYANQSEVHLGFLYGLPAL
ncbi:MAG: hypothetical protein HRU19_24800 [Pseudobacteriovorax sp.]|nr:hypothetical protein [Pseudobacteriovorax sp.]